MRILPLLLLLVLATARQPATGYDASFAGDTMRVDYFHTGGPRAGETFALDQVVNDGAWAGSRTRLVDDTNLGSYRFDVRDAGGRVIYSRGFASIYGEWATTGEAKNTHRTFHESVRFPWPKQPVKVTVHARDANNQFHPVWSTDIDPASRFVNRAAIERPNRMA